MSYQVFARKWRPQTFEEIIGQAPVSRTLLNAISSNRLAHAYLFSGARGVGKTTMARLLAKAVNCEKGPTVHPCGVCPLCVEVSAGTAADVLEIDGASNRGIDNIRELRDQVKYAPLKGKNKVYIIDEVHMLTTEAFNALLKTLEEPPPHTLFIMATTELHKIPATILSRCQQFHFKKISRLEMIARLRLIGTEEKINVSDKALLLIAKAANGSLRDALSLFDQVVSYGGEKVSDEDVLSLLGLVDSRALQGLVEGLSRQDISSVIRQLRGLMESGHDIKYFIQEWVGHLRNLIMMKIMDNPGEFLDLPPEEVDDLEKQSALFTLDQLQRFFRIFTQAEEDCRYSSLPLMILEVAFVQASDQRPLEPLPELVERLDRLAEKFSTDSYPARPAPVHSSPAPPVPAPAPFAPVVKQTSGQGAAIEGIPWEKWTARIREKKPSLESYLKQSLWYSCEGEEVKIGYPAESPFLAFMQKEENLKLIREISTEFLRRAARVQVVPLSAAERTHVPDRATPAKKPGGEAMVQKIQEALDGKIIEVKE